MRALGPGGILVINAIRKENADKDALLELEYPSDLWLEKGLKSVANVTRADIEQFLPLAAEIPIKPSVTTYGLERANEVLGLLKASKIRGAAALTPPADI
jgi:propanol-preferring alcohol dehydrogenase